jgi:hypothetical protein
MIVINNSGKCSELSSGMYNPEDNSEHHTRRRENLKSHTVENVYSTYVSECKTLINTASRDGDTIEF